MYETLKCLIFFLSNYYIEDLIKEKVEYHL